MIVQSVVQTTMHKRKTTGIQDMRPAKFSANISTTRIGIDGKWICEANCWITDNDGRQQFMHMTHDALMGLVDAVRMVTDKRDMIESNAEIRA